MARKRDELVKKAVISWVENNEHNPNFKFVVGNRSFSPQEIKDNVEKGTPEGEEILDMVAATAAHLFLRPRARK